VSDEVAVRGSGFESLEYCMEGCAGGHEVGVAAA
jgi:hypothetical protein